MQAQHLTQLQIHLHCHIHCHLSVIVVIVFVNSAPGDNITIILISDGPVYMLLNRLDLGLNAK